MCICVNCHWIDRCEAYHAVEHQHGVAHLNSAPDMKPIEPRIHVSVLEDHQGGTEVEWDVRECKSFVKDQGRWLRLRPGEDLPT